MSENPYESPATVSPQVIPDPWPRSRLRVLTMLFVLFGLAALVPVMVTTKTALAMSALGIFCLASGALSLCCGGLAIYGAVRNYRINVKQIERNRVLQNEVFQKPNL